MTALAGEDARQGAAPRESATATRLPPVTQLSVATLILVVIGGIDLAAHLPQPPPLGPPILLLAVAAGLLAANVATLSRVKTFAWATFFLVARWALLAYAVTAGTIEYVFVLDHTPGGPLIVLTLMLVVYAVAIPLLLAFSVARYQAPSP